ncbi:MAG: ferrochelatase [Rhodobacteraceae bacterium]|nr:ferrochelatase [Paracoccaceae bacterium]
MTEKRYPMPDSNPHRPADHPPAPHGRIGVLIANLGTPDGTSYWPMRRYLNEFLSDRRVIDYPRWKWQPLLQAIILTKRPFTSGAAYREVWDIERDEGPLLFITREQTQALGEALTAEYGDKVMVDFCMRYGNPSTAAKVQAMLDAGCDRILFFPLYPQYAGATTATANDQFFRVLMGAKWQPAVRTVPAYHDHPAYIEALAASIEAAYGGLEHRPDVLIASYHGMPERYLAEGDPYYCQCLKTSRLLRERLGWDEGALVSAFQSKFGPEEWLKPATLDEVARQAQAGNKRIAVIAPAFSADCLETLEEIRGEIREAYLEAGGAEFTYIPCLNADRAHIAMMADIVRANLAGWV